MWRAPASWKLMFPKPCSASRPPCCPSCPSPAGWGRGQGHVVVRVGSPAEESGVTDRLQSADFRGQGFLHQQGPDHVDEVISTEI